MALQINSNEDNKYEEEGEKVNNEADKYALDQTKSTKIIYYVMHGTGGTILGVISFREFRVSENTPVG